MWEFTVLAFGPILPPPPFERFGLTSLYVRMTRTIWLDFIVRENDCNPSWPAVLFCWIRVYGSQHFCQLCIVLIQLHDFFGAKLVGELTGGPSHRMHPLTIQPRNRGNLLFIVAFKRNRVVGASTGGGLLGRATKCASTCTTGFGG